MPNWCSNILKVKGNYQEVKKFFIENKSDDYDPHSNIDNLDYDISCLKLSKSVPMPKDVYKGNLGLNERNKYGNNNWYDWSIQNWGTKWDVADCYISNHQNIFKTEYKELKYNFLSAWSPPIQWFNKIISKYKNIDFEFEYIEEAMDFGGKILASNG